MLILTKIHRAKIIEDMYEKEYLYFKSLKDFRSDSNDKTGRLDPRELNIKNVQLKTLTVSTADNEIDFHKVFKDLADSTWSIYLNQKLIAAHYIGWKLNLDIHHRHLMPSS